MRTNATGVMAQNGYSWIPQLVLGFVSILLCVSNLSAADKKGKEKQFVRPTKPVAPKVRWQTEDDVIRRTTPFTATGEDNLPSFSDQSIGVTDFEGDPKGGPLLSNQIWTEVLERKGQVKVVDRSRIENVMSELRRKNEDWVKLSESEKAKQIGKLIGADFLLFGTITSYKSEDLQLTFAQIIEESEADRYKAEYKTYRDAMEAEISRLQDKINGPETLIPIIGKQNKQRYQSQKETLEKELQAVPSYETLETHLKRQTNLHTISTMGTTAKIVEVTSGKVVWVGRGSRRDTSNEGAVREITKDLLKSILKATPQP